MTVFLFAAKSEASDVGSTDACTKIHTYESYCGNLKPDTCIQYREGFDYWHNAEQKRAWDEFYELCGQDVSRDSHDCIAYLNIGASCESTVEARPAPVEAYHRDNELTVTTQPPKVTAYEEPVKLCYTTETYDIIYRFHQSCGDSTAASCPQAGSVSEDFARVCGDKTACECLQASSCGRDYCSDNAGTPASPETPTDTTGGEVPSDPGSPADPVTPGVPPVSNPPAGHDIVEPTGVVSVDAKGGFSPNQVTIDSDQGTSGTVLPGGSFAISGAGCVLQASSMVGDAPVWCGAGLFLSIVALTGRRGKK